MEIPTVFLTAAQMRPNKRIYPGDTVKVDYNLRVIRVGYLLGEKDVWEEAWDLVPALKKTLETLVGCNVAHNEANKLHTVVMHSLLIAKNFGGPERGIHRKCDARSKPSIVTATVKSTRYVTVGTRVTRPEDRPTLINSKRVLFVQTCDGEFLSSDCIVDERGEQFASTKKGKK